MSSVGPANGGSKSTAWNHRLQLGSSRILNMLRVAAQVVAGSLTRKFFLAAYEASDRAYWRHHASQLEWRSLGGIIEYSTDLLAVPGKRAVPIHLIAIRAASGTDLQRVAIKVKVKKIGIIHQHCITLNKLGSVPVRKALTGFPLTWKASKDGEWRRLGDIYIKLVEARDSNGVNLAEGKKIAEIFSSTGTDALPDSHVERWRQYWNVDEINAEKENLKTLCYRELVQSARKLGRPLTMRRAAYRLLTSRLGTSVKFWSQNLGNGQGIRSSIARSGGSFVIDSR